VNEHAETIREALRELHAVQRHPKGFDGCEWCAPRRSALDALVAENERLRAEMKDVREAHAERREQVKEMHFDRRALAERVREACAQLVLSNVSNTYVAERMAERLRALDLEPLLTPEGT
jgi:predicted  nucleic acid-binding Zn-ribbon protein